jgi:hypothetical protein
MEDWIDGLMDFRNNPNIHQSIDPTVMETLRSTTLERIS